MMINLKKTILVGLLAVSIYVIYSILNSSNFLFPLTIDKDRYDWVFNRNLSEELNVKYSFGNFKNEVIIYDINENYRCWIWRFNEYNQLPISTEIVRDSVMEIKEYVKNSYGRDPSLTTYNKMKMSTEQKPYLRYCCNSEIKHFKTSDRTFGVFGRFKELGVYNSSAKCEVKFEFQFSSNSWFVFHKGMKNYYLIVLYGINGNDISKDSKILSDFKNWN